MRTECIPLSRLTPRGRAGWFRAAGAAVCLLAASACAQPHPYVWPSQLPRAEWSPSNSPIDAGDRISVSVRNQETLSGEHVVRLDGSYPQPLIGSVQVQGLTAPQLAERLTRALAGVIQAPQVTVTVVARRARVISVLGEVRQPTQLELAPDEGVMGALARAGGLTEFADSDHIYVIRQSPTPLRIRLRFADLVGNDPASVGLRLHHGDVLFVE